MATVTSRRKDGGRGKGRMNAARVTDAGGAPPTEAASPGPVEEQRAERATPAEPDEEGAPARPDSPERRPRRGKGAALDRLARQILEAQSEYIEGCRTNLRHARRVGELLLEAKKHVEPRGFRAWVEGHCGFSYRTASDYMFVAIHWQELGEMAGPKMQPAALSTIKAARKALPKRPRAEGGSDPAGKADEARGAGADGAGESGVASRGDASAGEGRPDRHTTSEYATDASRGGRAEPERSGARGLGGEAAARAGAADPQSAAGARPEPDEEDDEPPRGPAWPGVDDTADAELLERLYRPLRGALRRVHHTFFRGGLDRSRARALWRALEPFRRQASELLRVDAPSAFGFCDLCDESGCAPGGGPCPTCGGAGLEIFV
jgi:hypothetical protein